MHGSCVNLAGGKRLNQRRILTTHTSFIIIVKYKRESLPRNISLNPFQHILSDNHLKNYVKPMATIQKQQTPEMSMVINSRPLYSKHNKHIRTFLEPDIILFYTNHTL